MGGHVTICWGDYTGKNFTDMNIDAPWQVRKLKVEKRKVGQLGELRSTRKFGRNARIKTF